MSIYFIAEAGVNHNGHKDMARQLIDVAAEAGADAIKFQTFNAEALASVDAPKATYQMDTTDAAESQLEMLKRLELPHDWHFELRDYCAEKGIDFLSTPFDSESLRFLVDDLKLETIKVPSGEVTNGPFLLEIAKTGCRVILSTGMCKLDEVRSALGVLAFGMTNRTDQPSLGAFEDAFNSDAGQAALLENVTVLHCTSAYPTPLDDANVSAMKPLRDAFGLKVGFSDHTEGMMASLTAAALGADVIEKHYTLDRELPGPDHKASLEPGELALLIRGVRDTQISLGDGVKIPRPSELETIPVARKSLVARTSIRKGDEIIADNITAKRPGTGQSPMMFWAISEAPATRDYDEGEQI